MSLDNVSEFANNRTLASLKEKLAQVEEEYCQLKPIYKKGGCDSAFYSHYSTVAANRQNLMDEIKELQKLIFNISVRMTNDDIGGNITPRQKEAYRLFELGDYEGCMAVLDADDIESDFQRGLELIEEQKRTVCKKYIREHKTAIDILLSMKEHTSRFAEIESRYKKIVPLYLISKMSCKPRANTSLI